MKRLKTRRTAGLLLEIRFGLSIKKNSVNLKLDRE